MQAFVTLHSRALPMPDADIDTDIIFPARYLTLTQKTGLAPYAFRDQRYDAAGAEKPGFVLNQARWRGAQILVAGPNFGCGSSREQAPWALADLGLRCVIAPSFGAIFEANCLRNGLLPLRLPAAEHALLLADAQAGLELTVNLHAMTITRSDGSGIAFRLPEAQRAALLSGLDEIALILQQDGERIAAFEARQRERMPWLYTSANRADNPAGDATTH